MTQPQFPPQSQPNPVQKRSPWGGWWLMLITCGIYYLVWYHKINGELAKITNQPHNAWGKWWNQIIPFWGLFGLHHTAKRLNQAHEQLGSSVRVSPAVAVVTAAGTLAALVRWGGV